MEITTIQALFAAGAPLLWLSAGLIPDGRANGSRGRVRAATSVLAVAALLLMAIVAATLPSSGPLDVVFYAIERPLPIAVGLYLDGVSAVMGLLIGFIGLVIARYSTRYLRDDPTQSRFLRWMSVTLGFVLLMVMSRNLVMFTGAWILTSWGLHQLLTHNAHRAWAVWTARKKFLISRLGDLLLIAALALTYQTFGSFEYVDVFATANAIHEGRASAPAAVEWIGALYVLGAMTKSAQFPFHTWLPDTMEAPTPVSALMHAGVINAGGFLIIRLSPLVSLSHLAMDFLALVGATTALLGGVVMVTQTSVKRSLAYSTIAQMGFMMLQCGLGAFSAALLHIVAHSAYKAHAFLRSGGALDQAARLQSLPPAAGAASRASGMVRLAAVPVALALAALLVFAISRLLTSDDRSTPGAAVLGLILTAAVAQLLYNGLTSGVLRTAVRSAGAAVLAVGLYGIAYLAIDRMVAASISRHLLAPSLLDTVVLGFVAVGFLGLFALQAIGPSLGDRPLLRTLYVHAMHGFYLDIPARRLTAAVWGRRSPVP